MAAKKGASSKKAASSAVGKKAAKKVAKKAAPAKSASPKEGAGKSAAKKVAARKVAAKQPAKNTVKKGAAKALPAKKGAGSAASTKGAGTKTKQSTVKAKSPTKKIVKGTAAVNPARSPVKAANKSVAKSKPTTNVTKKQTPEPTAQTPPPVTPPAKKAAGTKPKKMSATAIKTAMKNLPGTAFSAATGTSTNEPFSKKDLDRFSEMIHTIREENVAEFEELSEQLREMAANEGADDNSYSLHMAEQGTDAMEREKTFLQAQRTSDYIKKLDEALIRIQNGSFGICRVCGLRLDSRRLMAVPVTQVCTIYKNSSKPCQPGKFFVELTSNKDDEKRS